MFAIALWDVARRTLCLARDRFGEKRLYYGWVGHGSRAVFAFGSELKALRAHPGFANPVSREALALYLRFMYVPAPYSIYEGIYKLEPGCVLSMAGKRPSPLAQPPRPPATHGGATQSRWWSLDALVEWERSINLRTKQPLGAFLSGGVELVDDRGADAATVRAPDQNLHRQLRGGELRRSASRASGCQPSRLGSFRAVRDGCPSLVRHSEFASQLGRAVRGLVSHSDAFGLPRRAPARHRGAVRRRR